MTSFLILFFFALLLASLLLARDRRSHRHCRLPPGPTGWPLLGNILQLGSKPHQTLHALSKTYGPLLHLRFGSVHVIVASNATTAAHFLRTHDANFSSRPPNSGAEHIAYNYRDLVFAPYGPRWRMLRRLCALQLFSAKALENLRHVREEEVVCLVQGLARAGKPVDVGAAVNTCATNALSRALVGRRVFSVDGSGEGPEEFKEMVVELMRLAGVFNVGDFVPAIAWLDPQGLVRKMKKLHKRFDDFLNKLITEHQEMADKSNNDMLSLLVKLKDETDGEDVKLTDTEIKALLLNLFTAGTDTTSSTVEWALVELIRAPGLLGRLQDELDSVVGRDRLVSESDLSELPLLQAVVKETFRLHPSTPLSLPRVATEDCKVDGFFIPSGTTLLVNVWAIGRDPESWPDEPLAFRPDRFLPNGRHHGVDVKGGDFELIPFGAGRRVCAGLSLGLRMVQFMVATLVHAYNWVLMEGDQADGLDMEEAFGLTLRRAMPFVAHPVPRLSRKAYD
ncbi:hypothetical protein HPP92_024646 [Vanilla planifolia]|uniref:Flavonoid 3'-hydroxylase n=1 Tax=Vanilla planifolia TaxID=51239 RepID=A0A835PT68_VANPL|nr:hypothetical protein HPP92_024646 [Vanilla planifolia]